MILQDELLEILIEKINEGFALKTFRDWYNNYTKLSDDHLRKVLRYNFHIDENVVSKMSKTEMLNVIYTSSPSLKDIISYDSVMLINDNIYEAVKYYGTDNGFMMNRVLYSAAMRCRNVISEIKGTGILLNTQLILSNTSTYSRKQPHLLLHGQGEIRILVSGKN
jgi:hypothetical protein